MAKNTTKTKKPVEETTEVKVPETVEKEEVEADEAPKAPKSTKTEVTVTWNGGSRVYSLELHGKDFEKLAESFAEKVKGTVA